MADFTVIFKSLAPLATAGFGECDKSGMAEWAAAQDRFPHRDVAALPPARQLEHWCVDQAFHAIGQPDLRIAHNADGKPKAVGRPEIHVSIAHHSTSDGCWAAVACSDSAIGIDVEAERDQLQRIAPRFLSETERAALGASPAALAAAWAIKECMFKAFGPALDFRADLEVEWSGMETAEAAGVTGCVRGQAGRYRLNQLRMADGHAPVWLALGPVTQ
ncbi:MAG: 4'-phosphopantetheinyl transferase family protein [Flavobacteriales bacterium]